MGHDRSRALTPANGCLPVESGISSRGTTEFFATMPAMPDHRFDPPQPKRNSGRTGRRRLTEAEAALRGQHAMADHRRRYGEQEPTTRLPPLPDPPAWFTAELR